MKEIKSSTGGIITNPAKGVIRHTPSSQAYSGRLAEEGIEAKVYDAPKRGRGRPKKNVGASGAIYDFSQFLTDVQIPQWKGQSTFNLMSQE